MTFVASSNQTATPHGLARLYDGSSTTLGANNKHLWGSTENLYGTNICTVNAGTITLPSGYYYLLEGSSAPAGSASGSGVGAVLTIQFYNETVSSYQGTQGFHRGGISSNQDIYQPFSKDEMAKVWIDASGSSVDVSLRIVSFNEFSNIDTTQRWNGESRCLVWRFD